MKFVVGALVDTAEVLKKYRSLYLVYFLFALLPLITYVKFMPGIISFLLMFISLGWFVVRFNYLHLALQKKQINYKNLPKKILEGIKAFLPIVTLMLIVTLIPIFILLLSYGRWFAVSYLNNGLGLTTQEVFVSLMGALSNSEMWEEFFTQNFYMRFIYQVFMISSLTGLLIGKLTAIMISVQKFSRGDSIIKAFYYLSEHLTLLFSFLVLHVGANLVARIGLKITQLTIGRVLPQLQAILVILVVSYIWFFLDTFILAYFSKTIHSTSLKNKVMRWFRSKRK